MKLRSSLRPLAVWANKARDHASSARRFAIRSPEILVLDEGALIERLFSIGFDPIYFDRSKRGRLNAPDSSYGVLYAAAETRGAFAETFLREPGRTL